MTASWVSEIRVSAFSGMTARVFQHPFTVLFLKYLEYTKPVIPTSILCSSRFPPPSFPRRRESRILGNCWNTTPVPCLNSSRLFFYGKIDISGLTGFSLASRHRFGLFQRNFVDLTQGGKRGIKFILFSHCQNDQPLRF